jgi:hypothetical protein
MVFLLIYFFYVYPGLSGCKVSMDKKFLKGQGDYMGDKGKKDKGKREEQKKSEQTSKEKRKQKKDKKK